MKLRTLARVALVAAPLMIAACREGHAPEGTSPAAPSGAPAPASASASASASAVASAPPAALASPSAVPRPAVGPSNPAILRLAKGALSCKFTKDGFDAECPPYLAWRDEPKLFEDIGKAWPTLFGMLDSPDERLRMLAIKHDIPPADIDRATAQYLVALVQKETNAYVASQLGGAMPVVDMVKLGLGEELRALAKHPNASLRAVFAYRLLSHQNAVTLELLGGLLQDPERNVQSQAILGLSRGKASDEVCAALREQVKRTDDLKAYALHIAAGTKCKGIKGEVIAALEKTAEEPATCKGDLGTKCALALREACKGDLGLDCDPAVRETCKVPLPEADAKKGFGVAKRFTDPGWPDKNTRALAVEALGWCDPAAAVEPLTALTKDQDEYVRELATKDLALMKEIAAQKKEKPATQK